MKKRFMSLIMAVMMVVITININKVNADETQDERLVYASSVLGAYLSINSIEMDDVKISNPIPVITLHNNDLIDKTVFFVMEDDAIKGKLIVEEIDGKYYSCFDCDIDEFQDMSQIAVYQKETSLIYYVDGQQLIYNDGDNILNQNLVYKEYPSYVEVKFYDLVLTGLKTRGTPEVVSLSVPYVANSTYSGKGICWAACVAMDYGYRTGYSVTAVQVVDKCIRSSYFQGTLPSGDSYWTTSAYALYNRSVSYNSGGLIYARVYSLLSSGKTVHVSLSNMSNPSDENAINHAVLITGSYYDGNTLVYNLRDPNRSTVVSVSQSLSVADNASQFVYVTSGGTKYINWYRTFY